jgi:hypothetical protein
VKREPFISPPRSTVFIKLHKHMGQVHFVNGACRDLPDTVKTELAAIVTNSSGSKAGRTYWTATAKQIGLVDTEIGIVFCKNLPVGVHLVDDDSTKYRTTNKPINDKLER